MEKREYDGWYNYQTWLVNLWMDNDAGEQSYWSSRATDAWDDTEAEGSFSRKENAALALNVA